MLPCGFWHILRFQTPVTPAKGQLTEVSWLLRCGFSHSFTGSVQEVVQWMCRREALQAQPPDTPSSCETFTARRILWATPTAAGPSGDRSFGRLVKEVGQQTCRSADCTQCAQIDDRALAFQTRSSMRAAVEVIIHASRLVHEKRELSCNQSLFSCSVRR